MTSSTTSVESKLGLNSRQSLQHKATASSRTKLYRNRLKPEPQKQMETTIESSKTVTKITTSKSSNRHHRRHLREKRRATGINILSTESTGNTSTGEEDDDGELTLVTAKRIAQFNEVFVNKEAEAEEEATDLKLINDQLREQLRLKEEYISQLEAKIKRLELAIDQKSLAPQEM